MSAPTEIVSVNGDRKTLKHRVHSNLHFKNGHAPVFLVLDTPHEFMVPVISDKGQLTLVDVSGTTWVFNWNDVLFIQTEKIAE